MPLPTPALVVFSAALLLAGSADQARPNLSGTWALADAVAFSGNFHAVVGGGRTITLLVDAGTLTVDRPYGREAPDGSGRIKMRVTLDGKPVKQPVPQSGRGGPERTITATAAWDGASIVVKSVSVLGTTTRETTEVVTLSGNQLSITRFTPVAAGVPRQLEKELYNRVK